MLVRFLLQLGSLAWLNPCQVLLFRTAMPRWPRFSRLTGLALFCFFFSSSIHSRRAAVFCCCPLLVIASRSLLPTVVTPFLLSVRVYHLNQQPVSHVCAFAVRAIVSPDFLSKPRLLLPDRPSFSTYRCFIIYQKTFRGRNQIYHHNSRQRRAFPQFHRLHEVPRLRCGIWHRAATACLCRRRET